MGTSESELFKDKIEISLDGRQVFYLFFGGAVIATLVFVLGVMVGRRVEARTLAEAGSPETDPLAALDRLEGGSELAFPATLRGDKASLGSLDQDAEARGRLAIGGPRAKSDLSVKVLADPSGDSDASANDASANDKTSADEAPKKAADKTDTSADDSDSKADAAAAKDEAKAKAKAKRRFTLQVGSFQDKEEADAFFRQLSAKSYEPFMVEAEVPGKGRHYRVRLGDYASFDEAVAAKTDFEDEEHVIAYVTRTR